MNARRRVRGYSLLEFGIVLGVIGILLSTVVVLAQGMLAVARTRRAGNELWGIAEAASHSLARGRRFDPASGLVSFQPGPGLAPVGLGPTSPLCFNLAQVQGLPSTCRETGAASDAWGGQRAAGQTPTTASILDFLGGGSGYGGGYNPSCLPYVVCFYPARVDVMTCVPASDVGGVGLESTIGCGPCNTRSVLTDESTVCLLASSPALHSSAGNALQSYLPSEFTRTIPPTFTPRTTPID